MISFSLWEIESSILELEYRSQDEDEDNEAIRQKIFKLDQTQNEDLDKSNREKIKKKKNMQIQQLAFYNNSQLPHISGGGGVLTVCTYGKDAGLNRRPRRRSASLRIDIRRTAPAPL